MMYVSYPNPNPKQFTDLTKFIDAAQPEARVKDTEPSIDSS